MHAGISACIAAMPGQDALSTAAAAAAAAACLPPLCRDELPENDEEHPDAAAIKAIMADTTPEEQAEGFKVRASGGGGGAAGLRVCCVATIHRRASPALLQPSAAQRSCRTWEMMR